MRIGIDARLWNETGVGRYIRNLIWQLEKIDYNNEYVLFVSSETAEEFKINDLRFKNNFRIVATNIRWHTLEEQIQFPNILKKEKLDLVHFPYFSIPIRYKGPFVITIHDLIINHFPTGKASTLPFPVYHLKHLGYQYVMKQAAKKAKKILTVSEVTKHEIVDHLGVPEDKVGVTYEGVDERVKGKGVSVKNKSLEFTLPLPLNASPYFLYVGNAYPHKNLDRLIEAFGNVAGEKKNVKLLLVGREDYFYKQLKEKVKHLHLEESIEFCGQVSDEELAGLYKGATALITPSFMEGFGLPGLEAMQQGTLVLASDISVYREIYRDAAVYFDPLDVSAMHATIRRVLDKKNSFKKYTENGIRLAKLFSWEKMAKETLAVYESSVSIRQS